MLKQSLITTVLAASFFTAMAQADESQYVGTQYHQHKVSSKEDDANDSSKLGSISLVGGYQFSPFWALEFRHHVSAKDDTETYPNETYRLKLAAQQQLFLKGSYPVTDQFSVYGLLGYGRTKLQLDFSELENNTLFTGRMDFSKTGFTAGFGGEYQFAPQWSATIEYVRNPNINSIGGLKLDSLALGVNYRF